MINQKFIFVQNKQVHKISKQKKCNRKSALIFGIMLFFFVSASAILGLTFLREKCKPKDFASKHMCVTKDVVSVVQTLTCK